jgi:hypothetical protein
MEIVVLFGDNDNRNFANKVLSEGFRRSLINGGRSFLFSEFDPEQLLSIRAPLFILLPACSNGQIPNEFVIFQFVFHQIATLFLPLFSLV